MIGSAHIGANFKTVCKEVEKIVEVPVTVAKEVIKYKDDPLLNHPKIQEAIKHARRAGEWD